MCVHVTGQALLQVINPHANKVVVPSPGQKDDNGNYVRDADKQGDGKTATQKKKNKKDKVIINFKSKQY